MSDRWEQDGPEQYSHKYKQLTLSRDADGYWIFKDARTSLNLLDLDDCIDLPEGVILPAYEAARVTAGAISLESMPIDFYNDNGAEITIYFSGGRCLDSTSSIVIEAPQTWKRIIPAGDPAHSYQVGPNGRMMGDGQPAAANTCYALYVATGTGGTDYLCFPDTVAPTPPPFYDYQYIRRIGFLAIDGAGVPFHFHSVGGRVDFSTPELIGTASGSSQSISPGASFLPADRRAIVDSAYTYSSGSNPSYQLHESWQSPPTINPQNFGWVTDATITPATGTWTYRSGAYMLDASREMRARTSAATGGELRVWARGWVDDFRSGQ